MLTKPPPANGDIVYIEGYEFRVADVALYERKDEGTTVVRFRGICTDSKRNDRIRNTSYNGGVYGWRVT